MRIKRFLKFALIGVVAIAGFGFVVMSLWNAVLPPATGWHTITFWQAVGLLILSKILFGGFRGGRGWGGHWRHRMQQRWEQMTPEEREKFREGMRSRCGGFEVRHPEGSERSQ